MKSDAIAEPRSPGDAPAPAPGEAHVWRLELAGDDRRGAARAGLARILADYLGGPTAAALVTDPGGKPRLAEAPERLSFNLSHSGGLALVAVAPGAVGVDVERVKPRRDLVRLAARWLPEDDAATVAGASGAEREAVFYAAWTRHEARVKCGGGGLTGPPPGPEVVAQQLEIDDGYAAAVATSATSADRGREGAAAAPILVRRFEPQG
jgi:phosphopantetheinyl transferase